MEINACQTQFMSFVCCFNVQITWILEVITGLLCMHLVMPVTVVVPVAGFRSSLVPVMIRTPSKTKCCIYCICKQVLAGHLASYRFSYGFGEGGV